MKGNKNRIRSLLQYFISPVAVIALMLVIYFIKNIFPFGGGTIANAFSASDLAQSYSPVYTQLYDFLHGDSSIFFSWLSGAGINTVSSVSFVSIFSPLNIFFFFIPRDLILEYMSVFLLLKTALMAFAAFWYFKKRFSLSLFWSVIFSIAYALCGYVMMYYVHIMWLDTAILLPFLLYAAENVLREKKVYPFIILFALTLILNLYLAFMISIFLLIAGGMYILLLLPADKRGRAAFRFISGVLISLLLSAWLTVPTAMQMLSSTRAGLSLDPIEILVNTGFQTFSEKLFPFIGIGFAAVTLTLFFFRNEKNMRVKLFCAICILVPFLPVIFENINLIWHLGLYYGPANRMGFISVFAILSVCAYAISKFGDKMKYSIKSKWGKLVSILGIIVATMSIAAIIYRMRPSVGAVIFNEPHKLWFILALSILAYILALRLPKNALRYTSVSVVFAILTGALCMGFIAVPDEFISFEQSDDYISDTLELRSYLSSSDNSLDRVKNEDVSLNVNYPFFLARAALSNWTHSMPSGVQHSVRSLGYTHSNLRILDCGGTVFSDSILNIKQIISQRSLDPELYTFASAANGYNMYDNKYALPLGLLADSSILSDSTDIRPDSFAFSNAVYHSISGDETDMFSLLNTASFEVRDGNILSYKLPINGKQVLYYYNNDRFSDCICTIKVNGEAVTIPFYKHESNMEYPTLFNNGAINLGVFQNEIATIELTFASEDVIPSSDIACFAAMSLDKMRDLCNYYKNYDAKAVAGNSSLSLSIKVTNSERSTLFLPIGHDPGWQCTVNGEPCEIKTALGCFMCVELPVGINQVEFRFSPYGMKFGLILTATGLVAGLAALLFCILRKKQLCPPAFIGTISAALFIVCAFAVIAVVYALPIFTALLLL